MKNLIYKTILALMSPVRENLSIFLTLWFGACSALSFYIFQHFGVKLMVYYVFLGAMICYPIVVFISLLNSKLKSIIFNIFFALACINNAADAISFETTGGEFGPDQVALIMGTNLGESAEFFQSYFTPHLFLVVLLSVGSCVLLRLALPQIIKGKLSTILGYGILITLASVVCFTNITKSQSWSTVFLGKYLAFSGYSTPPDLKDYATSPDISRRPDAITPSNIVMVIGESFNRDHSSLYGYTKKTNPELSKLEDSGLLLHLDSVTTPAVHTIQAVESILSTYDDRQGGDWLNQTTLFDISKAMGYNTTWLSNQSRVGAYDNIVTKYAELADSSLWVGLSGLGLMKKDYDELLLPYVTEWSRNTDETPRLLLIHMIGSHPEFSGRYPDNYNVFSAEDYDYSNKRQCKTISEYDNSILYNDAIISNLITSVSDLDAIVLYFPDHGLDLYESDSRYCGHGKDGIPESVRSAEKIPLWIYVSEKYNVRNPSFIQNLSKIKDKPVSTADIIYSIADLMGISLLNGQDVKEKSMF